MSELTLCGLDEMIYRFTEAHGCMPTKLVGNYSDITDLSYAMNSISDCKFYPTPLGDIYFELEVGAKEPYLK